MGLFGGYKRYRGFIAIYSTLASGAVTGIIKMVTVDYVVSILSSVKQALSVLVPLMLTTYLYPEHATVNSGSLFDYIIVGGGAGGSIMANRLSANPAIKVLLIEAGVEAPFESQLPALNAYLLQSVSDWAYTATKDEYSNYHINETYYYPAGKMLGGSSAMLINFHAPTDPAKLDEWAEALGDKSLSYENMAPYFKISENLQDAEILASTTGPNHGTKGPIALTRQTHEQSEKYFEAFKEIGENIILDKSGSSSVGYLSPLYEIDNSGNIANPGRSHLSQCKGRKNFYLLKQTLATKINFDSNKNAVSVNAVGPDGTKYEFYAKNEIIVSAGAIGTPKLLQLSGIGPKSHLESLNINVIQDLPVGQSLQDLYGVIMVTKMEKSNAPKPAVPPSQAIPCTLGFASLNKEQTYPDYLSENWMLPHQGTEIIGFCTAYLTLNSTICQDYLDAQSSNDILMSLIASLKPKSKGKILISSADPFEAPLIHSGYLSDPEDLEGLVRYIEDYTRVLNSTYFKSVNAELIQPKLTECEGLTFRSTDYWRCYVQHMLITLFKYVATCPMGSVVDTDLLVKGVQKLRVVDASVFLEFPRAYPLPLLAAIAEKAAATVLEQHQATDTVS